MAYKERNLYSSDVHNLTKGTFDFLQRTHLALLDTRAYWCFSKWFLRYDDHHLNVSIRDRNILCLLILFQIIFPGNLRTFWLSTSISRSYVRLFSNYLIEILDLQPIGKNLLLDYFLSFRDFDRNLSSLIWKHRRRLEWFWLILPMQHHLKVLLCWLMNRRWVLLKFCH